MPHVNIQLDKYKLRHFMMCYPDGRQEGWTQAQLATTSNVSVATISRAERGIAISTESALLIARALKRPLSDIVSDAYLELADSIDPIGIQDKLTARLEWFVDRVDGSVQLSAQSPLLRIGDLISLCVYVNKPAYLYLNWIDCGGKTHCLYPASPDPDEQVSTTEITVPRADTHGARRGWELTGPSGVETVIAAVRRTALSEEFSFSEYLSHTQAIQGDGLLPSLQQSTCRDTDFLQSQMRMPLNLSKPKFFRDPLDARNREVLNRIGPFFDHTVACSVTTQC